jgi:hypothetical protein
LDSVFAIESVKGLMDHSQLNPKKGTGPSLSFVSLQKYHKTNNVSNLHNLHNLIRWRRGKIKEMERKAAKIC